MTKIETEYRIIKIAIKKLGLGEKPIDFGFDIFIQACETIVSNHLCPCLSNDRVEKIAPGISHL